MKTMFKYFLIFTSLFVSKICFSQTLKIVSLAPNLTEILFALKLGPNIVGDTIQCDYPNSAKTISKIGDYTHPNIERILSLHPNVVVATMGNPRSTLNQLKILGIHVIEMPDPISVKDLSNSILDLSKQLGVESQGHQLSNSILKAAFELDKKAKSKKRFLFVLQYNPIYSVSNKTWVGNLFSLGGYENVVGTSRVSYPVVSNEYLIKNRPDIVFATQDTKLSLVQNELFQRKTLAKIFGKKDSQYIKIIILPKDILVRPGPRVTDALHFIERLSF